MTTNEASPIRSNRTQAAVITFLVIVIVLMVIALLNAPTMGGPKVMESATTYLQEVRRTALPFLGARMVYQEWPNPKRRLNLIMGYLFLSPYLLITLTFTVGVVLFAFYISFNNYDIFTPPQWVGLTNYAKAFRGFTDPAQKDFVQSLYNVFWYSLIVVPTQTAAAILLATLLNTPIKFRQFFRTIFYAPSVTSSVVITLIFIWFYLKTGYINFFFAKFFGIFGLHWQNINWLGDPRGLFQLVVEAFGGKIPSTQWYLRGPSIAWMAIMFQNIFTTAPTFMIMFLAALQDINPALYEAAAIDGANGWQQFRKITLPLLRPIILLVGHDRRITSVGPGLPGNEGWATRHLPDARIYYFPGSLRISGSDPDGICVGAGIRPGSVDLLLYVFATPFPLERNAVVLGGSHGCKG